MTFLRVLFGSFAVAGLLASGPARAQANYRTAPIGGRSELMGGTGMTYGMDASAGFLNPATAVLVDDTRLSFGVNFYLLSATHAPHWYTPGPIDSSKFGDLRFDSPSNGGIGFDALPSSLCLFFRAGDIAFLSAGLKELSKEALKDPRARTARIGFCAAAIEKEDFGGAADNFGEVHGAVVSRQVQSVTQHFQRFGAGPTYAMWVSNLLAIGASVHGNLATHRSLMSADATTYGGTPQSITSSFYRASRGDSFDLNATLGATLHFGKQTVGMSLRTPSLHVYGVGAVNEQIEYAGAGTSSTQLAATGSFTSKEPYRVGLGTGLEGTWGQAELDFFYTGPLEQAFVTSLDGRQTTSTGGRTIDEAIRYEGSERAKGVVGLAAGAEAYLSPAISLLGGASTDLSAVPQGALGSSLLAYFPTRTNRLAGSFGIASHGAGGEVIFGSELSVGWGQRLAVNSYQLPPVVAPTGLASVQVTFVIAGATSLRTLQRALEDVKEVGKEPKRER